MSLKETTSLVMFSKELALSSKKEQQKSLTELWSFVCEINLPKKQRKKIEKDFALHFTGQIELYRQYADAAGITFQPEVIRLPLSVKQQQKVKEMLFDVYDVN